MDARRSGRVNRQRARIPSIRPLRANQRRHLPRVNPDRPTLRQSRHHLGRRKTTMKYLIFVLTLLSFLVASALLVLSLGNCAPNAHAAIQAAPIYQAALLTGSKHLKFGHPFL